MAIEDLLVSDIEGHNELNLPKTFTQREIPVNRNQIPHPELFSKWPHLQEIANQVKPFMPELQIGLLIGSNCPIALEPLKLLAGGRDGPYATLLKHGWTINGPVEVTTDTYCHNQRHQIPRS